MSRVKLKCNSQNINACNWNWHIDFHWNSSKFVERVVDIQSNNARMNWNSAYFHIFTFSVDHKFELNVSTYAVFNVIVSIEMSTHFHWIFRRKKNVFALFDVQYQIPNSCLGIRIWIVINYSVKKLLKSHL